MAPTLQSRAGLYAVVWGSGGVFGLAEDNVHRHRTSSLLNCALSSETIADSLSSPNGQLTFSGHVHVLLDCTSFTTSSFLSGLLTLLLIPSIHPPSHSPIHPSNPPTHSPTYPPTYPHPLMWVSERTDDWMDDWMRGLVNVCWLTVSSSLGLREIRPRQRPLPIG